METQMKIKHFRNIFKNKKNKQIDKEIIYDANPSLLGEKCWGDDISGNKELRIKEQTTKCDLGPPLNEGELEAGEDDFDWGEQ